MMLLKSLLADFSVRKAENNVLQVMRSATFFCD